MPTEDIEDTSHEPWWTTKRKVFAILASSTVLADAGGVMANWGHLDIHTIGVAVLLHAVIGGFVAVGFVTFPG